MTERPVTPNPYLDYHSPENWLRRFIVDSCLITDEDVATAKRTGISADQVAKARRGFLPEEQ